MGSTDPRLADDEAAIRRLAALYARAMDRNEPQLLAEIFTPDAVIEGAGFVMQGLEQIGGIPAMLKGMYSRTLHQVHNQTVTISGDSAEAETYCSANHLTDLGGGGASILVWAMRYQDRLLRHNGRWRFQRRTVVIDWTETRPAQFTSPPVTG
ncbi:MAG: nuclear transport factor 2 family protein [Nevskiales bacterium]